MIRLFMSIPILQYQEVNMNWSCFQYSLGKFLICYRKRHCVTSQNFRTKTKQTHTKTG